MSYNRLYLYIECFSSRIIERMKRIKSISNKWFNFICTEPPTNTIVKLKNLDHEKTYLKSG